MRDDEMVADDTSFDVQDVLENEVRNEFIGRAGTLYVVFWNINLRDLYSQISFFSLAWISSRWNSLRLSHWLLIKITSRVTNENA